MATNQQPSNHPANHPLTGQAPRSARTTGAAARRAHACRRLFLVGPHAGATARRSAVITRVPAHARASLTRPLRLGFAMRTARAALRIPCGVLRRPIRALNPPVAPFKPILAETFMDGTILAAPFMRRPFMRRPALGGPLMARPVLTRPVMARAITAGTVVTGAVLAALIARGLAIG